MAKFSKDIHEESVHNKSIYVVVFCIKSVEEAVRNRKNDSTNMIKDTIWEVWVSKVFSILSLSFFRQGRGDAREHHYYLLSSHLYISNYFLRMLLGAVGNTYIDQG